MHPLTIRILEDDLYVLVEDVIVESLGYKIQIKKGFSYDGASIPRAFWSLLGNPLSGEYKIGAIVHDALYSTQHIEREITDKIFLDIMIQDGVGVFKRNLFYYMTRLFGKKAWDISIKSSPAYKDYVIISNTQSKEIL